MPLGNFLIEKMQRRINEEKQIKTKPVSPKAAASPPVIAPATVPKKASIEIAPISPATVDRRTRVNAKGFSSVAVELILITAEEMDEMEFDAYLKGLKK